MHNDDPRLGTIMETIPWKNNDPISCIKQNPSRVCVALVGFPFDMGVIRNGGVPGAKNGPSTLRMILHKLGTMINPEVDPELDIGKYVRVIDCGDVEIAAGLDDDDDLLERAHAELTKRVELLINANAIPFVVGGGNDQSYANFCGLKNSRSVSSVSVVNVDAHFDVRPRKLGKVHSGSPFREMLEDPGYTALSGEFCEFAAQGHQCSKEHADYVLSKKGRIIWMGKDIRSKSLDAAQVFKNEVLDRFSKFDNSSHKIFVSFDIDSIRGSDCPGVSCPGVIGLNSDEALRICYESGRNPQVALMDASEFNPVVEQSRTARLLATMFYFFVLGVATRTRDRV